MNPEYLRVRLGLWRSTLGWWEERLRDSLPELTWLAENAPESVKAETTEALAHALAAGEELRKATLLFAEAKRKAEALHPASRR